MITLLVFGVAVPGLFLGALFQNGSEVKASLLVLAIALMCALARDWRANLIATRSPRA